jgi:APA family basic amino acid/polyamine antiporter
LRLKVDSAREAAMSSASSPADQVPPAEPPRTLHRELGLFDATMLVAGTMIGSGIFIVAADIARDVGSSGWACATPSWRR